MAGVDDCVAVGELRFLWQRGVIEDRLCGCGERFSACPFWAEVMRRAFPDGVDAPRMVALQDRGTRMRYLPSMLVAPGGDLRVVQLVRDPRATAVSWSQQKSQHDGGAANVMQTQGVLRSAALWSTWNAAAEVLFRRLGRRYLRLRYEDLIGNPEES